jgi:heme-degrading monooxygenase HmoA
MFVILFRTRLTPEAGPDYEAKNAEMEALVRDSPGFVDVKSYVAEDGERLSVVWWRDAESLAEWRDLAPHRVAQETGRRKWYQSYTLEVAEIARTSRFERP